jgi:serine/threonine protein kinase
MGCINEELVQRFLVGALSVDRLSEVERHIDACKTCFDLVVMAAGSSSARAGGLDAVEAAPPGMVIAGRYRIVSLLGVGASGQVFEAFDQLAQARVALKALRPNLAADPRWVVRMTRELQIARRIDQRHVCRVLDLEEADGRRFLVMELAAGSLRTEMKRAPAGASRAQALADARAIVAALEAIHRAGIVHRDVKPENVLRMPDGRLVLSDFGLAAIPTQQATLTLYVGTPSYMAPELSQGEAASAASDIWSLGVVLHELLLGGRPRWKSEAGRRTLIAPAAGGPFAGEPEIEKLCAACLSAVPEKRPASAGEIGYRLEVLAAGGIPGVRQRWSSRLAVALLAGAVLSAGAFTVGRMLERRQPTAVPEPVRPLVLYWSQFTEATPAWAGARATRLVAESLGQIAGIELRPWTENDRDAGKAGLRPWLVTITNEQRPDRLEPQRDRDGLIPVGVATYHPDGRPGPSSSWSCPANGFAECLQPRDSDYIKGSLKRSIQRDLIIERARREARNEQTRSDIDRYFRISAAERTSGVSIETLRYLNSALEVQPDFFPALLERAQYSINAPGGRAGRSDWLLTLLEALRKKRPGEPGLATLYCRAATIRLLDGSPSDGDLRAAEDACGGALKSEIDNHPALFSLAQLKAKRCDAKGALELLQTIYDERGGFFVLATDARSGSLRTPASRAGRDLTALLLIRSLPPLENESQWVLTTSVINGAASLQRSQWHDAEAHFFRALTESRAQNLWSGSGSVPTDAHRAAATRGIKAVLKSQNLPSTAALSGEPKGAEFVREWGPTSPFALLPYYWVDPAFARQLLGSLQSPAGCNSAVENAMLLQALGDSSGRDAALAGCKEDHPWVRSCRALLTGPIQPAPLESVALSARR